VGREGEVVGDEGAEGVKRQAVRRASRESGSGIVSETGEEEGEEGEDAAER